MTPSTRCFFTDAPRLGRKLPLGASPRSTYGSPAILRQAEALDHSDYDEVLLETHGRHGRGAGLGLGRPIGAVEEEKEGRGGEEEDEGEGEGWLDLQAWVDQIPILLSQETPMEVVVQMYQRLGLRFVLFTRRGALTGIMTKMVSPCEDKGADAVDEMGG